MIRNKLLKMLFLTIILGMLTSCISIPIGDGKKVKLSRKGVTISSKDGEDISAKVDEKDGSFSIKGKDEGGKDIDINLGLNKKLPEELPKDFPIPKGAVVEYVNRSSIGDEKMIATIFNLSDLKDDLEAYHDKVLDYFNNNGHEITSDQIAYGQGSIIATDEENNIFYMITYSAGDQDDPVLSISMMINFE